jgi:positive regulator of sigma E activity
MPVETAEPTDNSTASQVLEEVGRVLSTQGGKAVVRIPRSKECAGCHGCSLIDPEQGMVAEVDNPLGASPGDAVRIETRGVEGKVKAALLLFAFPMAMLLAGAIGSQPLFRGLGLAGAAEGLGVLAGLVLMAGAFALIYYVRKRRGKQAVRSRIVAILDPSQVGELPQ